MKVKCNILEGKVGISDFVLSCLVLSCLVLSLSVCPSSRLSPWRSTTSLHVSVVAVAEALFVFVVVVQIIIIAIPLTLATQLTGHNIFNTLHHQHHQLVKHRHSE